ncbi:ASTL, partial [Symbiodinium pilosum]
MQRDVPECLGCFPLLPDDGLHESPHAYDDTCIHWNSTSPCRSGLPFYSMRSDSLDTSLCHSFCTAKGLDLSGIVRDKECRCGASRLNRAVWMGKEPRPGLLLPSEGMT